MDELILRPIAVIRTDFPTKFGIPRQSGLMPSCLGEIIFEPEFRDANALRGLDGFTHLWLIWGFSAVEPANRFAPMVKPPRLGGNTRMGVFATRSPFRPNPIGLSSVRLESIESRPNAGTVLIVSGVDLMDGTPIYDIKPYLPFTDIHTDAVGGFSDVHAEDSLQVVFPQPLLALIPEPKQPALIEALGQDPRPAYCDDPDRLFGFYYAGFDVRFTVADGTVTVQEIVPMN
jgi:tRNA-Thr(GGU) m(6)t(6)A37 methyltransferase TsaA